MNATDQRRMAIAISAQRKINVALARGVQPSPALRQLARLPRPAVKR